MPESSGSCKMLQSQVQEWLLRMRSRATRPGDKKKWTKQQALFTIVLVIDRVVARKILALLMHECSFHPKERFFDTRTSDYQASKTIVLKEQREAPSAALSTSVTNRNISRLGGNSSGSKVFWHKIDLNAALGSTIPLVGVHGTSNAIDGSKVDHRLGMGTVKTTRSLEIFATRSIEDVKFILSGRRQWMKRGWIWTELECSQLDSDRDLFKALQQSHQYIRSDGRSNIEKFHQIVRQLFSSVISINYVKVNISEHDKDEKIRIIESPSLPPDEERERYSPCGRDFDVWPPISPALLAHYYNNPDCATDTTHLLDRIPKKLYRPIIPRYQDSLPGGAPGWGIEIQESLRIGYLVCLILGAWPILSVLTVLVLFERPSIHDWMTILIKGPVYISFLALTITSLRFLYERRVQLALRLEHLLIRLNTPPTYWLHQPWLCDACGESVYFIDIFSDVYVRSSDSPRLSSFPAHILTPRDAVESHPDGPGENNSQSTPHLLPPPATYGARGRDRPGVPNRRDGAQGINTIIAESSAQERLRTSPEVIPRILICANTALDKLPRVHEKMLCEVNDQQFFGYLRSLKRSRESWLKPSTWFTGVVAINYVAFEVLDTGHVSLLERPGYAPPSRAQDYHPCKVKQDVTGFTTPTGCFHPLPSHLLLRLYRHPELAGVTTYYIDRLTKKTSGPLTRMEPDHTAYGLELEEGIIWTRTIAIGTLLLALCAAAGTGLSRAFHDVQTGAAIVSCMVPVVIFIASTLAQDLRRSRPVYGPVSG